MLGWIADGSLADGNLATRKGCSLHKALQPARLPPARLVDGYQNDDGTKNAGGHYDESLCCAFMHQPK
jgi:hypothetical protein